MNQNVEKYVNGLSPMVIADIVISYEGCMYKNWCTHEETEYVVHTKKLLDFLELEITNSRRFHYSTELVNECYRYLARKYIIEN